MKVAIYHFWQHFYLLLCIRTHSFVLISLNVETHGEHAARNGIWNIEKISSKSHWILKSECMFRKRLMCASGSAKAPNISTTRTPGLLANSFTPKAIRTIGFQERIVWIPNWLKNPNRYSYQTGHPTGHTLWIGRWIPPKTSPNLHSNLYWKPLALATYQL